MTKTPQPKARPTKPARASGAPRPRQGQETRTRENAPPGRPHQSKPAPFAEIQELALTLETKLAQYGQATLLDEYVAAGRVVEALRILLQTPRVFSLPKDAGLSKKLARGIGAAARDLRALAKKKGASIDGPGRYPVDSKRVDKAARALMDAVERGIAAGQSTPAALAVTIEVARTAHAGLGTSNVLPHLGTGDNRIALFTTEIEKVRNHSDGGELDSRAVVTACARACGNKRELFGAERKREIR